MAREIKRYSELKRFEAKQRRRDFLVASIETIHVTRDILAELVSFLAKRTLGLVSPLFLVGFILLGIAGIIGWMIFLWTRLFHHF